MSGVPGSCEVCGRWKEIQKKYRIAELAEGIRLGFQQRLEQQELKPTVAEYLKLLQVEQEIEQDSPKEIKVTWVETPTSSNGEK